MITVVLMACEAANASANPTTAPLDHMAPGSGADSTAAAATRGGAPPEGLTHGVTVRKRRPPVKAKKSPWRGTEFVYGNTFSALSLSRSSDLTYNPYYAMSWGFRLYWWFSKSFYVKASLDIDRELTESDITSSANEALLRDLVLKTGLSKVLRIPVAKIDFSFDLDLTIPTSKASQARTLVLGIGPGVRLSRRFKVLKGLTLGYNMRWTVNLHRYTTGELESPLITGCSGAAGCDSLLSTGRRNAIVRLSHFADLSIQFMKWFGFSVAVGQYIDWLHGLGDTEEEVTLRVIEPENQRFVTFFDLQLSFRPTKMLEIVVGYASLHPQRAPDSTHYSPFFNRYATLYLNLKFKIDEFIALFKGESK